MKKLFIPALIVLTLLAAVRFFYLRKAETGKVLVLPALHQFHEQNEQYTVEKLFAVIRDFQPDVIALEIRPEDMKEPAAHLQNFYPDEMVGVRDSFPAITTGIDFYSKQVAGKVVNRELFTDTATDLGKFIALQQVINTDSLFLAKQQASPLDSLSSQMVEIAKSYSPNEMIAGRYDSLTEQYYETFYALLDKLGYTFFHEFNQARDVQIAKNALKTVQDNPDKRVLVLIGANHRAATMKMLKQNVQGMELVDDLHTLKAQSPD